MKSNRWIGLSVALFLLLITPAANAGQFSLRFYGGGNYLAGGDLNKGLQGWADYWNAWRNYQGYTQQTGSFESVHFGLGAGGDLLFHLNPHWAVGLGTELVAASKTTVLSYQSPSASIDWEYSGKPSAVPVKISAFYFMPLGENLKVGLHAGAGYYWAKAQIESRTETSTNVDYLIDSSAKGIGYHGGVALEMKLLPGLSIFIEAAGRYLALSGFEGSVTMDGGVGGWEGTLRYWEAKSSFISRYEYLDLTGAPPTGEDVFLVREAKIDFSGASFRIGVVIGL